MERERERETGRETEGEREGEGIDGDYMIIGEGLVKGEIIIDIVSPRWGSWA